MSILSEILLKYTTGHRDFFVNFAGLLPDTEKKLCVNVVFLHNGQYVKSVINELKFGDIIGRTWLDFNLCDRVHC